MRFRQIYPPSGPGGFMRCDKPLGPLISRRLMKKYEPAAWRLALDVAVGSDRQSSTFRRGDLRPLAAPHRDYSRY
jgi:hypothetical protein